MENDVWTCSQSLFFSKLRFLPLEQSSHFLLSCLFWRQNQYQVDLLTTAACELDLAGLLVKVCFQPEGWFGLHLEGVQLVSLQILCAVGLLLLFVCLLVCCCCCSSASHFFLKHNNFKRRPSKDAPTKAMNMAKGRNFTSILHVPLSLLTRLKMAN